MHFIIRRFKRMWSLLTGLSITGKYFFAPTVTVHYPRKTVGRDLSDSFRGPIELIGQPNAPEKSKCISCLLCMQACPSGCITVAKSPPPKMSPEEQKAFDEATARGEKPKKPAAPKTPSRWVYDFSLCSLCACCVEACPADAIRFSHDIYLVGTSREDFVIDQLSRLKRLAAQKTQTAGVTETPTGLTPPSKEAAA